MKKFLYSLIAIPFLLAAATAQLLSPPPPFPIVTGVTPPPGPITVFQYCWPAANVISPCTATAAAPAAKGQPQSGQNNYSVVSKILSTALNPFSSQSHYNISLQGLTSTVTVDAVWIGQSASTGTCTSGSGQCAWDFVNPTQLTKSSATSFVLAANTTTALDVVSGTLASGVAYTLAVDIHGNINYPAVTPNTTTFNTSPKACASCYTSWATSAAGTGTFTGSITGTVLTVSAITAPSRMHLGSLITGNGTSAGTVIVSLGTGAGTTGTYNINNSQNVGSATLTASQAASLGKGNGSSTTAGANAAWVNTANIVPFLGIFIAQ
jgi:hypothetical protein